MRIVSFFDLSITDKKYGAKNMGLKKMIKHIEVLRNFVLINNNNNLIHSIMKLINFSYPFTISAILEMIQGFNKFSPLPCSI